MKYLDLLNFYNLIITLSQQEKEFGFNFNWFLSYNLEILNPIVKKMRDLELDKNFIDFLTQKEIILNKFCDKQNGKVVKNENEEYVFTDEKNKEKALNEIKILEEKFQLIIKKQNIKDKKYEKFLSQECDKEIIDKFIKIKKNDIPKLKFKEFQIIKVLIL